MRHDHLFTSDRLGFRGWEEADLPAFAAMNADPAVMAHFPSVLSWQQSADFMARMQAMQRDHGYCYYAVEALATGELLGFVGLCEQTYEAPFTPCVDVGWRLMQRHWGRGYAQEGARRCLTHAFETLGLERVHATAPVVNRASIHVMERIGMRRLMEFDHPRLLGHPRLLPCACYVAAAGEWGMGDASAQDVSEGLLGSRP